MLRPDDKTLKLCLEYENSENEKIRSVAKYLDDNYDMIKNNNSKDYGFLGGRIKIRGQKGRQLW